jgi:hypothetical protein
MKIRFTLIAISVLATVALAQEPTGPFGLHRGMTQEQVIQLVGKDAIRTDLKNSDPDALRLSRVPKSHPGFEFYSLLFSPKDGLLKIIAYGNTIDTNVFGETLHKSLLEIRDVISQTYGQPQFTNDYVKTGSIWTDPQDWMMGLLKHDRMLSAAWGKSLPNHIFGIVIEANALSQDTGYLTLFYEFDGWNEYVDARAKKAGTVF